MNETTFIVIVLALAVVAILAYRSRQQPTYPETGLPPESSMNMGPAKAFYGPSEVEEYVREHIAEIAADQFPDNAGVDWRLLGFNHRVDLGTVFVEVEPDPDEVGYSRFQFAFVPKPDGAPKHVATYSLESGRYSLMSTSFGAPSNLPRHL